MHEHYFLSIKQPSISARLIESPRFEAFSDMRTCCSTFLGTEKDESANSTLHIRTFQRGIWLKDKIFISRSEIVFCACGQREQWSTKNARCINHGRFKLNFCGATEFFCAEWWCNENKQNFISSFLWQASMHEWNEAVKILQVQVLGINGITGFGVEV